ncbi:MAG TPA: tetratricopeptide repeat protein [Kofleriaceae bacterium]|jgi:tetratricopeptide (TPR) repeat protein
MTRLAAVLLTFVVACGGGDKKGPATPQQPGKKAPNGESMKDGNDPDGGSVATGSGTFNPTGGTGSGSNGGTDGSGSGSDQPAAEVVITPPNFDPDPAQAKTQVDAHLTVARGALSGTTPDGDTALREAKAALAIDAANVDAAAMVALAYYHKKLYDTAELVLDDLYKRDTAKNNANVNYVYGLVYDVTNRPERAMLAYQKAVQLDPNHVSALTNLGVHQLKNGQYTEAQATFERLTREFKKNDAITLTSLGSAYRGRSADYASGSGDRNNLVQQAEQQYKHALQADNGYGPAYYNLGLLYLDNDPYPGLTDPMARITASKQYFDQYKNMRNVDMKLYDERLKDVSKIEKRIQKQLKSKAKASKAAPQGNP